MRLALACLLVLAHALVLRGDGQLDLLRRLVTTPFRVQAFFVISGFLVFRSYEHAPDGFLWRRLRRIYPAYAMVVLTCAVGLIAVTTRPVSQYFTADWVAYVSANLAFLNFLHPTLPGAFDDHLFHEVNGALWTMKVEVLFYALVPLLVWLCLRLPRWLVLSTVYVAGVGYLLACTWLTIRTGNPVYERLSRQLPGQLPFFMAGAFLYYYLGVLEKHVWTAATAAIVVLAAATGPVAIALRPVALAVVVMVLSLFVRMPRIGRLGSWSYAIFLCHFPIVQVLLHAGLMCGPAVVYLTAVLTCVIACAAFVTRLTTPAKRVLPSTVDAVPAM